MVETLDKAGIELGQISSARTESIGTAADTILAKLRSRYAPWCTIIQGVVGLCHIICVAGRGSHEGSSQAELSEDVLLEEVMKRRIQRPYLLDWLKLLSDHN